MMAQVISWNQINLVLFLVLFNGSLMAQHHGFFTGGGGATYHTTYQAVLDYADGEGITLPTEAQKTEQNTFCQCLDDDGILGELDFLIVAEGSPNKDFALINWIDPGTPIPTSSGTINFATADGLSNANTSSYLDLNWNETDGVNWTINDASMHVWTNSSTSSGAVVWVGAFTTGSGYGSVLGWDGSSIVTDLQEGNQNYDSGYSTGSNYYSMDRASSSSYVVYKNGSSQATNNDSSQGEYSGDMFAFALNLNGSDDNNAPANTKIYIIAIGGSLSGLHDEFYTCMDNYIN